MLTGVHGTSAEEVTVTILVMSTGTFLLSILGEVWPQKVTEETPACKKLYQKNLCGVGDVSHVNGN